VLHEIRYGFFTFCRMADVLKDIIALGPITIVSVLSLVVLTIESLHDRTEVLNCWVSILGLAFGMAVALNSLAPAGKAFGGMVTTGGFANYFAVVFCVAGIFSVMLSKSYIRKEGIEHGEYYSLLLLAVVGMMLMAAAADLIIFFLGLELMSISFYVMAGFARQRLVSNEAALKYFLLGAFATGFLLYGIALLYGTTGTTNIGSIAVRAASLRTAPVFLIGLGLVLVGLAFKVGAVPFHMWVPDVYEGSPTTVAGFMSTGGKAAAFSAFLLVLGPAIMHGIGPLREALALIAALSMIVGNVLAIAQTSIKRMLAYSSIAHAGYILTGVVAANGYGENGVLYYLLAYTVMNVGAFGVLSVLESNDGQNVNYEDYAGLSSTQPLLAGLMAIFMFSLTGIPPFAGFFSKYYVFAGAVEAGYTWLAIVGVLMSAVSAYYYLRVVVLMYFKESATVPGTRLSTLGVAALVLSAITILVLGIVPSAVLSVTAQFF
jgi:NADH-quinone oxidoreductase subunit N